MHAIYKYRAPIAEKFVTNLPKGARLIRVEDVDGEFFIWAMVDINEQERTWRWFECYKTGQPIETDQQNLLSVGRFRMFIMQELMLYVFENTDLSEKWSDLDLDDEALMDYTGFQIYRQP